MWKLKKYEYWIHVKTCENQNSGNICATRWWAHWWQGVEIKLGQSGASPVIHPFLYQDIPISGYSHIKIFTYQDIHISRYWWQGVEIKLGQSGASQSSTHSYIKIFTYQDIPLSWYSQLTYQDIHISKCWWQGVEIKLGQSGASPVIHPFLYQDIHISGYSHIKISYIFCHNIPISRYYIPYPTSFFKIFPYQDILHPLSRYQNGPFAAQYSFIDIRIFTFSSFLVPNNPPTDFYLCIQPKSLCPRKLWQYIVTLRYKLKNYRNLPPFLMAFKDALTSHSCIVFVLTFACLFVWSRLKGGDRLSLEPDIRRPLKNLSPNFPP